MRIFTAIIPGKTSLIIGLLLLLVISCDPLKNPFLDEFPENQPDNKAPDTHLFLNFAPSQIDTVISGNDTTITYTHLPDTTTSQQILYWWGEDPDGEVMAYHYRWNFQDDWTRTTSESDTFFLPLQVVYNEFIFEVKAEDNEGAFDPSPASLRIPVANSPPKIEFALNSNPAAGSNPNVTHVTFPTRTFAWETTDLDGIETVKQIRYRLDSTNTWQYLKGDITNITLTDINPGYHTFYVQAIDTAGAFSNLLQFPDSTDLSSPNGWRVDAPLGDILLIDDYKLDDGSTHTFYTNILDSLVGSTNYSIFEVGSDEKALPGSNTDQVAMYNYFKTVIWYHYSEAPSLSDTDGALRTYLENGGNVFISSIFIDTDYTFTSIDSNWVINPSGRLLKGLEIDMVDPSVTDSLATLPQFSLKTSALIARRVSAYHPADLIDGELSRDLFVLQDSTGWSGNPPVAQLFQPAPGSGQSIFFSLPFHFCDANNNMFEVFNHLLFEVFK